MGKHIRDILIRQKKPGRQPKIYKKYTVDAKRQKNSKIIRKTKTSLSLTKSPTNQKSRLKIKGQHLYTTLSKIINYTQKNTSTSVLKTLHCQILSYFFLSTPPKKSIKELASKLFLCFLPTNDQTQPRKVSFNKQGRTQVNTKRAK